MGLGYLPLAVAWLVGSGMLRPGLRRTSARNRDG
jgi:hypothetical protein